MSDIPSTEENIRRYVEKLRLWRKLKAQCEAADRSMNDTRREIDIWKIDGVGMNLRSRKINLSEGAVAIVRYVDEKTKPIVEVYGPGGELEQ